MEKNLLLKLTTAFTTCNASCGGGFQSRKRFCNDPEPMFNGAQCMLSNSNSMGIVEIEMKQCKLKSGNSNTQKK